MNRIPKSALVPTLLLSLCMAGAFAQNTAPPKSEEKPVPGFEAVFTVGTLLTESKEFQAARQEGATLTQKRTAVDSKPVADALRLLRDWLNRPGNTPKTGALADAPPSFMESVKQIGQVFEIEQYVSLSTGRAADAIDSARDALRFSQLLKPNTLLLWRTGAEIDTNIARHLARHLEQLSRRDCDRLTALTRDWLRAPDLMADALNVEKPIVQRNLQQSYARFNRLPLDPESASDSVELSDVEVKQAWPGVAARIDAVFARLQSDLKKPYTMWETAKEIAAPKSPTERLERLVSASVEQSLHSAGELHARQQAIARMLACHAAIITYRWEHESLPPSLEELKIGDTITDPFTGMPFVYKVQDKKYTLESVGPEARDDQGRSIAGQRKAISLTPRPAKP